MTLILRRVGETSWHRLGKAGECRVGLCEVVGMFRTREWRVVFLPSSKVK